jgi:hypothetical protein
MSAQRVQTRAVVRSAVKRLLVRSPSFSQLPQTERRAFVDDLESVVAYLSAPEGLPANTLVGTVTVVPFQELVDAVDFPDFVAGLIEGVFETIVDSSIQQMIAYAQLLKEIAKTVAAFVQDNVSDGDGRDYLVGKYPRYFEVDKDHYLRLRDGIDRAQAAERLRRLDGSLKKLDAAAIKNTLIPAARRRITANRQQLLASMVLTGIHRIDASLRRGK